MLKRAGYTTAAIGKWHLGLGSPGEKIDWNGVVKPGPLEVGFDYSFIIPATPDRVPCVYLRNHRVYNLDPADPIHVSYKHPLPGEVTYKNYHGHLKMKSSHGHMDAVINGIGGTQVPFITFWPGHIKPGVSDALISQVDLLASLAALSGQSYNAKDARDSDNLLPVLLGKSNHGRQSLVEEAWGLALRSGDWKYIPPGWTRDGLGPWKNVTIPKPGFLFDVAKDPGETKNLAAKYPEKLKELRAQLREIQKGKAAQKTKKSKPER